jgi:hypothetical protein
MTSIMVMKGRQENLDKQLSIRGRNPEVYDARRTFALKNLGSAFDPSELWITDSATSFDLPFVTNMPVITGCAEKAFTYSTQGDRDRCDGYIAIKMPFSDDFDKVISELGAKGVKFVMVGREVNKVKAVEYAQKLGLDLDGEVKRFFGLSKEEQEKMLRLYLGGRR